MACPYDVLVFHYCCPGYAQVANEAVTQAGPAAAQPRLRSLANDLREFMRDTRLEDWMEEHGGWVSERSTTGTAWWWCWGMYGGYSLKKSRDLAEVSRRGGQSLFSRQISEECVETINAL